MPTLVLLLLLAVAARADPEAVRGAAAVGATPSAEPALRREGMPSSGFALGASLKAWANAAEEVREIATHTTGDGGDAEALAEACSDERIAFNALEQRRAGIDPAAVVTRAAMPAPLTIAWRTRVVARPAACP